MKRIHQASGKTIVMVTHDIDEALRLGTQIVLLEQGRILQVGSPLALLSQPSNDQVADFVGGSDVGIKLLSLQNASSLARLGAPENGPSLPVSASLREAVSILALHRCNTLNLRDDTGANAGDMRPTCSSAHPLTLGMGTMIRHTMPKPHRAWLGEKLFWAILLVVGLPHSEPPVRQSVSPA